MNDPNPFVDEALIESTLDEIRSALEAGRFQAAVSALLRLHPADRADAFSDLDGQDQASLLPRLNIQVTADLLEELEDEEAADIAETMATSRLADVLDEMEPDEAADVLGDIPSQQAMLALAEMEAAHEVIPLLEHADETAGGLMTTSYLALEPETTVAEALEFLREQSPNLETPYYLYVVDKSGHLTGVVTLRGLVISEPDVQLKSIMDPTVFFARVDTDQEDSARLMTRYDLAALPVVDHEGVLVGVITYDDVVDVLEEEATEDIYRLANVPDADLSIESPIGLSVRRRLPWLLLSSIAALFASYVISRFEPLLAQVAVLAVFQSVVAGMGGNAATQSLAIVVRALALGEIATRDAWRTVVKESATGLIQGLAVGAIVGLGVYLWKGNLILGLILSMALSINMLVAVIVGTLVPLLLKALRLDPALASTVLVTAVTDSVGFAVFLGLAAMFLPH